ncbi:MAG: glycosyl hydrolase 53 family protein [Clostridia bacterium]|nr:glycosyl hydrolase 53 family protein [Clostridia bacterium]
MHSNFYSVYGTEKLEEQVHLAAEMGCKILRNNFDINDISHVDTFVKLCNAYGIQIMLEYGGNIKSSGSETQRQEDYTIFKMIANRYNGKNGHGKIDYIQMENELDVYFAQQVASYGGYFGNGDSISNYPQDDLKRVCNNLKNASAAIRDADSDVRIVINAGWMHYGMFQYFQNEGLDYDILGWDWYTDMSSNFLGQGKTAFGIYDTLDSMFHKPIIICETNTWNNGPVDEDDPAAWDGLVKICEDAYSKPNVIGCIFYQMCDQLNFEKEGSYEREAHFGFIYADKFGNMTGKKAAYDRFQYICGGMLQPMITLESLEESEKENPADNPTDKKEDDSSKKEHEKRPVTPTPHDDTPFDGSAFGDTDLNSGADDPDISDVGEGDVMDPINNNPVAQDPVRTIHKGNVTEEFVWTFENTLTVIVAVVALAILSVFALVFANMRKKIKAISQP